jgi:HAD superfamily hydrolase (TIGR01490 family)
LTDSRIAVFDIDGTLITESVWDYFLRQPEIAPAKRGIYARFLPTFAARKLGIIAEPAFREGWVKQMAATMRGWQQAKVDALFDRIVYAQFGDRFRPDVKARVQEHLARGERVLLASGMFEGFAQRFAQLLGAEAGIGTRLAFVNGVCSGTISGRGCAGEEKPRLIAAWLGGELAHVTGYADSYSDLPMLTAVGQPVATYPDEALKAHAVAVGWQIIGS